MDVARPTVLRISEWSDGLPGKTSYPKTRTSCLHSATATEDMEVNR